MPLLSKRITQINDGGSDGWEILYKSRRMIADGVHVTQLTIGEHDIKTSPRILEAMDRSARGGALGYAPVNGTDRLREAIAKRATRISGVETSPENILVTPGGQAALFAAHAAALNPGEKAAIIAPYYATYAGVIRNLGAVPKILTARSENGFQPMASDLDLEGCRSLLINSPSNPTGAVYGRETLETISKAVKEANAWLISDEVYDAQIWEGRYISPRNLPEMSEQTFVIGSMSKSHAMTGSRIGWLIAPRAAIKALTEQATVTTYGVPGYIQDAAEFALSLGPEFEEEIAAPFRRRRDLADAAFQNDPVIRLIPAQGAMYVMLDIRATGLSGIGFADRLLEEHHIAVMPGESFGEAAAGHLRVALTTNDEEMEAAFQTIKSFAWRLSEQSQRHSAAQ